MAFEKMEDANVRLANYFPGAVTLSRAQLKQLIKDPHSILYGEKIRLDTLMAKIEQVRRVGLASGFAESLCHRNMLLALHDFYVGSAVASETGRYSVPMYDGSQTDFASDIMLWRAACDDVEKFYAFSRIFLAPGIRRVAQREPMVRNETDPVNLLALARKIGNKPHIRKIRQCARLKLVFGQFYFEQRRSAAYSPEQLALISQTLAQFFNTNLFDGAKEEVVVVATLNEKASMRCEKWSVYRRGEQLPPLQQNQRTLHAIRRWIKINGERVPLLCFVRTKEHALMKVLNKEGRFLQLGGFGDGIGVRFVVERQHLEKVVDRVRDVLVACPGQVCDQASSIGFERRGRLLDNRNTRSSRSFEAMKYNAMAWGKIIEVQFIPWEAWVDSIAKKSEVNHNIYKLKGFFQNVFPILYPELLFGVRWEIPSPIWDQCVQHVLNPHFRIRQ